MKFHSAFSMLHLKKVINYLKNMEEKKEVKIFTQAALNPLLYGMYFQNPKP